MAGAYSFASGVGRVVKHGFQQRTSTDDQRENPKGLAVMARPFDL